VSAQLETFSDRADHHEGVLLADLSDERVEMSCVRIEAGVRLVEEEHIRSCRTPARSRPLQHAAREVAHQVEPSMIQLTLSSSSRTPRWRQARRTCLRRTRVLLGGEVGIEKRVVADEPDTLAKLHRVLDDIEPDNARLAP